MHTLIAKYRHNYNDDDELDHITYRFHERQQYYQSDDPAIQRIITGDNIDLRDYTTIWYRTMSPFRQRFVLWLAIKYRRYRIVRQILLICCILNDNKK